MLLCMRTTIEIPEPLFRQLKRVAAERQMTIRALIESSLRQFLTSQEASRRPFKLKDGSVRGAGLQPGLQGGSWEQLRDLIYEGRGA